MQVCKNLAAIQDRINILESHGYHIRLVHEPKTTKTTTMIIDHAAEGAPFYGLSVCNPSDQFSRSIGTRYAFGRAIHDMSSRLGRDVVKALFDA